MISASEFVTYVPFSSDEWEKQKTPVIFCFQSYRLEAYRKRLHGRERERIIVVLDFHHNGLGFCVSFRFQKEAVYQL